MFPLFPEDFCTKLNPILAQQNKYVKPKIENESTIKMKKKQSPDGIYIKLISIDFTKYTSTSNIDYTQTSFNVDSLNYPLKAILARPRIKSNYNSSLLVLFDNSDLSDEENQKKVLEKSTDPDICIEIIYPVYSTRPNKEIHPESKRNGEKNFLSKSVSDLPIYLKIKEKSSKQFLIRIVPTKTDTNENLFEAITQTIIFTELSSQEHYIKLVIPYNLTCKMRYERSKHKHRDQILKEFSLLEAIQTNALDGVHVRRKYCDNTSKTTRMIPLLLSIEKNKLKNLGNYVNKMMPTYIKHGVPEAEILSMPTTTELVEERRNVRSWLKQFKS